MLIEVIESIRDEINCFDLTRGVEDYKFKLGGQLHYNFIFIRDIERDCSEL